MEWSLSARRVLIPKDGLLASECEDAIAIRSDTHRFCLADGATEAYDSRRWAKLLTKHWVSSARLLSIGELGPWIKALGERVETRWKKKHLPWYAEEKARGGAFAAFVGLAFFASSEDGPSWQAIALGDSCLVHKRDNEIVKALPISDPHEFTFHPTLIPSSPAKQTGIAESFTIVGDYARPGDVFLLLTDAIAAWYLQMCLDDPVEAAKLDRLLEAEDAIAIEKLISSERSQRRLRNDDIAIIRILVRGFGDGPPAPLLGES